MKKLADLTPEQEVEFLERVIYHIYPALGPADDDIMQMAREAAAADLGVELPEDE